MARYPAPAYPGASETAASTARIQRLLLGSTFATNSLIVLQEFWWPV